MARKKKIKEDFKGIEGIDIIIPAKDLHEAIVKQTKALESQTVMDKQRLQELRLAVSSMNACIRAVGTKVNYFKLVGYQDKLKYFKKHGKKLSKKKK